MNIDIGYRIEGMKSQDGRFVYTKPGEEPECFELWIGNLEEGAREYAGIFVTERDALEMLECECEERQRAEKEYQS